jgi:hypothetical protein
MLRIPVATIAIATLMLSHALAQEASPEERLTPMQASLRQPSAMEPYAVYEGGAVTHGDMALRPSCRRHRASHCLGADASG